MIKVENTALKVLAFLILLGALVCGYISWERYHVEKNATTVEMVYDYNNIVESASVEHTSMEHLFSLYKKSGITSLAVYDETLEKLMNHGHVLVYRGSEMMIKYHEHGENISTNKIYIQPTLVATDRSYFEELKKNLFHLLGSDDIRMVTLDGIETIEVNASYHRFLTMPLGIFVSTVKDAEKSGLYLVLRPHNEPHITKEWIDNFLAVVDSSDHISAVLFQGKEVLGYKEHLGYVANELKKRHIPIALVEAQSQLGFEKQAGIVDLAKQSNYQAVRAYAMSKDELIKIDPKEAASRFYISTIERNIRLNLFPSYKFATGGHTLSETNAAYISDVTNRIENHGFSVGKASVMEAYFPNQIMKSVAIAGAVSMGVWFLILLIPYVGKYVWPIEILAVILFELMFFGVHATLTTQLLALVCAVTTPVIVVTLFIDYCLKRKKEAYQSRGYMGIFGESVILLWICGVFSLIGALYVSGLLSDIRFLLEMEIFRGVKLTFVLPIIFISLIYIQRFPFFGKSVSDGHDFIRFVKKFCQVDIKLGLLVLLGVLGVAGFVFVGRSGNNGAPVPHFEIVLRRFLESIMYARPREKEFLLGHPAVFLSLAALYRKWPQIIHYLLIVAVTVGQGSIVETFAHMRSPFILSFIRGIDGLAVGTIVAVIVLVGTILITKMTKYLGDCYEK